LNAEAQTEKTPLFLSWVRSQMAALSATGTDFLVTILLTEVFGVWYAWSNATGAFCGAVVSFLICRRWVFNVRRRHWHRQALRYALASGLSLVLNTSGVWLLTENLGISYIFSKMIVATFTGLAINFLMFRYFVFK